MIRLLKAFKYDNSYDYIKMFATKQDQENYFNTIDSMDIHTHNYVKERQSFRVEFPYDTLVEYGANYLIFDNGDRDVYAFITSKEYINEKVTRINYEIDVIQTYMFNFTLQNSYVERKVCSIGEISDFDEGLQIGEHLKVDDIVAINKTSKYFAMFNGFKEQELIFNDQGKLISAVDIPYNTSKPLTTIDNVPYPLYFMPLQDTSSYRVAMFSPLGISTGGSVVNGDAISKKLFRFIKGYEGFASEAYLDSGGVPTIGYGITESNSYWNSLFPQCTEQRASEVLAESMYNSYAVPLYEDMQSMGVDMATVKQHHFDAFLDLCYNGGLGAVTSSPMYSKWINNPNDSTITNDWLYYYVRDNSGTVLEGLIDRRRKEIEIFLNANYIFRPIVSVSGGVITDNEGNGYIPPGLGGDL